jgi:hypothetical protein
MKARTAAAFLLATCVAAGLQAQQGLWENEQLFERLGLNETQRKGAGEIVAREDKVIREAQAELNIRRAQLEKLLLDPTPDMREVERILQSSLEWKLKSEMAGIRRRVEIRALLGEEKWEDLVRAWRGWRLREARDRSRGDQGRPPGEPGPQRPRR